MTLQTINARFSEYHHIETANYILMVAETLPDLPFDSISAYGAFDMFSGNRQSQTRVAKIIGSCQYGQIASADLAGT